MSYDISLIDPETKQPIILDEPHQERGGTYAVCGTREAWLNITYNYSKWFFQFLDREKGIRWLYGQVASGTLPRLKEAIAKLQVVEGQPTVCCGQEMYHDFKMMRFLCKTCGWKLSERHVVDPDGDYWAPTARNARLALESLIRLAEKASHAIWEGD